MYISIILLFSGFTSQVWCQNISLRAGSRCYNEGGELTLNVTYVGNDSISDIEWNLKTADQRQQYGSGLNLLVYECELSGHYPKYFPEQERVQYHCAYQAFTDRPHFIGPKRTHYEGTFMLKVGDLEESEIQNATWTVTLWLWNSLSLATKSVVIHECGEGFDKTSARTTSSITASTTASTTTVHTELTTVSSSKTVHNKPSPYVLSPTDMYNIIGK